MRLRLTLELCIALAAAALLLLAGVWWFLADTDVVATTQPTWNGKPVSVERATVPEIGEFQRDYDTNDLDPFVPDEQRISTDRHIRNQIRDPHRPRRPVPSVTITTPPMPKLTWPSLADKPPPMPIAVGWVAVDDGWVLMARMSDETTVTQMHIGDRLPPGDATARTWTLLGITDEGLAEFRDPSGKEEIIPIGAPLPDPPPAPPEQVKPAPMGQEQPQRPWQGPANAPADNRPKRPRRPRPAPGVTLPGNVPMPGQNPNQNAGGGTFFPPAK